MKELFDNEDFISDHFFQLWLEEYYEELGFIGL